jgi:hypothetical protein
MKPSAAEVRAASRSVLGFEPLEQFLTVFEHGRAGSEHALVGVVVEYGVDHHSQYADVVPDLFDLVDSRRHPLRLPHLRRAKTAEAPDAA